MRKGWTETTLGEVVEINPEATRGMTEVDEIIYVDLASVSAESGISSDLYRGSFGEAPGRARRVIRTQDVLVSTVRPYLRGFALVPSFLDGEIASTGFAVLRASPNTILSGLVWAIVGTNNFVDYLMDRAIGSSYPAVRPEDIASFNFSLPPLVEQKRIVDVVSSVDSYIDALQQQADTARTARNAVLHGLLEVVADSPIRSLKDLTLKIGSGATPRGGESVYQKSGVTLIRSQNVHNALFLHEGLVAIDNSAAAALDGVSVEVNDVLINITGASVARTCLVDETVLPARVNQHVAILRTDSKVLLPGFLLQVLLGQKMNSHLLDISGSGTTRQAITKAQLESSEISVPPISEQKRIVEIASSMDEMIQSTEQAVEEAKNLRSGLLSDLLSGEHEIPESYDQLLGAA